MKKLNPKQVILIINIVMVLLCFSPWVSIKEERNWDGMEYSWGKATFAANIFMIIVFCLDLATPVSRYSQLITGGAIAVAVMVLFFYMEVQGGFFSGHIAWRGKYKNLTGSFVLVSVLAATNLIFILGRGKIRRRRMR